MKNSKKKSPINSKKTVTKNPLKKYVGGGPAPTASPTIGSFYGGNTGFGAANSFGATGSSFGATGSTTGSFGASTGANNYGFTPMTFDTNLHSGQSSGSSLSNYSGTDKTLDNTITPDKFDGKKDAQEKIKLERLCLELG